MLRATTAGELHRPPRTSDGESPLAGIRSFTKPLKFHGSKEDPDKFGLQERIPLEFAEDSPDEATERADTLEELLDEQCPDLERADDGESSDDDSSGIDSLEDLDGVGPEKAEALREACLSIADLEVIDVEEIAEAEGISESLAAEIKTQVEEGAE